MTDIATTPGFTAVPDGRVLRITITNPRRKNAIDYDTMVGLGETVRAASQNTALRVIVLTGEGGDFCTGADLAAAPAATARGVTSEMTMDAANAMIKAIVDSPLPVIARVRGAAAGIGAAFALAADLTYLAEDSYLLLAFINIGLMPDGGAGGGGGGGPPGARGAPRGGGGGGRAPPPPPPPHADRRWAAGAERGALERDRAGACPRVDPARERDVAVVRDLPAMHSG
ncbi:enoyl-CoA hydratase-related protein [Nocardia otitidiscaviarum]|uniref:enoyl-CoA hydratase-related protein n=1 Tax=Nocardia otitidiscaviarum TaxID=1823 RepID=UPI0024546E78|nr:enoyl-CoA hydratase-related protein [Nocardia otitidiscaviarum]